MKQKILYKAQSVKSSEWVYGGCFSADDMYFIVGDNQPQVEVIRETIERLVHEENEIQYFTGDKLAVYSEYYPNFKEALADGEACVSEIDDYGLVILENEESLIPICDLSYCHKFYHISQEEYEKISEG